MDSHSQRTSSSKVKRLEQTAYHEAGHAAMSYWRNRRFRHVTIAPGSDFLGQLRPHKNRKMGMIVESTDSPRRAEFLMDTAMILLAGHEAAHAYAGARRYQGTSGDLSQCADALQSLAWTQDPTETTILSRLCALRVKSCIKTLAFEACVRAVAAQLLAKTTLTGKEVYELCTDIRTRNSASLKD